MVYGICRRVSWYREFVRVIIKVKKTEENGGKVTCCNVVFLIFQIHTTFQSRDLEFPGSSAITRGRSHYPLLRGIIRSVSFSALCF
jgi:hypothetical protein